jgi:hypothetical protein
MLICLKVSIEWPRTSTCWNFKNCGFSICIGSTTSWTSWEDSLTTIVGFGMRIISSVDVISSSWMLVITWFRLGLGSSSIFFYVAMASNSSPPPFE